MVHTAVAVAVVDDVGQYLVNSRCVRSVQAAAREIHHLLVRVLVSWKDTWFLRGKPGFVGSRTLSSQGGGRVRME